VRLKFLIRLNSADSARSNQAFSGHLNDRFGQKLPFRAQKNRLNEGVLSAMSGHSGKKF
jgi:hypothetical protein